MAKLPRVTAKIFASNAAESDIGQYGSALAGTKITTSDISQIQALPAYEIGWRGAVVSDRNYPTLQEMNGLQKTFSQQIAYILQSGIAEWDAKTEYFANTSFCQVNGVLYQAVKDNTGVNPTTDNAEIWKEFKTGSGVGLQLFDTILKDHVLTYEESKGLALQGTYVYKEPVVGSRYGYPDFYAKCLEERNTATATEVTLGGSTITMYVASNGHQYYDIANLDVVDNFFNTMGSAWFYGVDTENERILLPRNNNFEQLTGDISEVGQSVEAGLPNITGNLYAMLTSSASNVTTGALNTTITNFGGNDGGSYARNDATLSLDASRSSSIYGNSDTVQPPAVKKLLYICVGNTVNYEGITDVVNQGMDILEQVNQGIETRVQLDGSNAEFPYVIEAYKDGSSWYNVYSNGWCEQGGLITGSTVEARTITFLKPFSDTDYYFNRCNKSSVNGTGTNFASEGYMSKGTTEIQLYFYGSYAPETLWEAKGYIQQ